jgi:hypothetical protein
MLARVQTGQRVRASMLYACKSVHCRDRVHTPSSPVRERDRDKERGRERRRERERVRKRERERERERERYVEYVQNCYFYF